MAADFPETLPESPKHILLIHSYHPGYEWTRNLNNGVIEEIKHSDMRNIMVDIEYMDARRFPQPLLRSNFIDTLKIKYTGDSKPDIVICADNKAYELLKEEGGKLFGQTPVVFCGVNGYTGKNVRYASNVTGIVDNPMSFVETIWLIKRLQPKAKELLIISDHTTTGKAIAESIQILSQTTNLGFKPEEIKFLPDISYAELEKTLKNLTPTTAVLHIVFTRDSKGINKTITESTSLITTSSSQPVFTAIGMNLGYGVVGGKVSLGARHGEEAAKQAIRILKGEAPAEIPIASNINMPYIFDEKQLERFKISKSKLPADSKFINVSRFWELLNGRYRIYTISAIILLVIQAGLITLLLANRRQLVNMQSLLQHSRRLYMSLVNDPPVCVCQCEPSGKLTFANRTFSEFFMRKEESCRREGLQVICAGNEQDGFRIFLESLSHHSPSRFFEHTAIRSDGQLRHLRWIGRPVYNPEGNPHTIQLIGEDITEIRQAYQTLQKKEQRFRMVADYTNNWEYWLSAEGELLYISPSCENFTGFSRDEFFLRPELLEELVLPEDRALFQSNSKHEDGLITFTFRLRQRSGDIIWIEQANQCVHDSMGTDLGHRISNRNVTDRKKAENALLLSESNLRATIHAITDALITVDLNGVITNLNKTAEDFCGFSLSSAFGRRFSELFSIYDKDNDCIFRDIPQRIFENRALPGQNKPANLLLKGARERLVVMTGALLNSPTSPQKSVPSALIVLRDVTRQRQVETQLRYSQKMDAIGQLAGGVAHDFNNMLGGIIGAAELLYHTAETEAADKYSKIIIRTAERAATLTSQLLTFARRSSDMNSIIDMHQIINDACDILERSIDKRIVLVTSLDATDTIISGDPSQLENAMINLGLNARDSMPEGGRLFIRTENVYLDENFCGRQPQSIVPGYYIQVCVSDTGHGIPEEIIDRIFDPFFTTKDVGKGTGLGLAAAYGIMLEHNGTIRVNSRPDHGSEFFLLLPISSQNIEKAEEERIIPQGHGTILLADDEEVIRYTAKVLLESGGYEVLSAENGREAVDIFRNKKDIIDLVLLDIIMPELNGAEAFAEIRKISPKSKIIICSGYLQDENLKMLRAMGAKHFISKPYRKSRIMQEIFDCLEEEEPPKSVDIQ